MPTDKQPGIPALTRTHAAVLAGRKVPKHHAKHPWDAPAEPDAMTTWHINGAVVVRLDDRLMATLVRSCRHTGESPQELIRWLIDDVLTGLWDSED